MCHGRPLFRPHVVRTSMCLPRKRPNPILQSSIGVLKMERFAVPGRGYVIAPVISCRKSSFTIFILLLSVWLTVSPARGLLSSWVIQNALGLPMHNLYRGYHIPSSVSPSTISAIFAVPPGWAMTFSSKHYCSQPRLTTPVYQILR